eukprot:365187-Chlamydomonas_euryale.AAC.26
MSASVRTPPCAKIAAEGRRRSPHWLLRSAGVKVTAVCNDAGCCTWLLRVGPHFDCDRERPAPLHADSQPCTASASVRILCTRPDHTKKSKTMTADPRKAAEEYLEANKLPQLLEVGVGARTHGNKPAQRRMHTLFHACAGGKLERTTKISLKLVCWNVVQAARALRAALQLMTAELLFHKPDDPRAFIIDYLTKVKTGGTRPLLDEKDLETVFGMFDVVQRGVINVEQADAALRNVLGPSSSLGLEAGATLTKEQFVDSMSKAMQANVPYKQ